MQTQLIVLHDFKNIHKMLLCQKVQKLYQVLPTKTPTFCFSHLVACYTKPLSKMDLNCKSA
jgi:hypothetical protein